MWNPTHVNVVVQRAENLLIKGKNGTNNAFVVIELGKESYRTSVKERSGKSVLWNEECELKIPKAGNVALLVLTAFHRNALGLDQFLGIVKIPLNSFNKYHSCEKWYKLEGKPGKKKTKEKVRGELEIEISFFTKSKSQSLTCLEFKKKNSIEKLTGSLFGLTPNARKLGWEKISKSIGKAKKKSKSDTSEIIPENVNCDLNDSSNITYNNLDPGVISDEEESRSRTSSETFRALSEKQEQTVTSPNSESTQTKLYTPHFKNPRISISICDDHNKPQLSSYLYLSEDSMISNENCRSNSSQDKRLSTSCVDFSLFSSPKPEKKFSSSFYLEKNHEDTHKRFSKLAKKLKRFHSMDKGDSKKMTRNHEKRKSLDDNFFAHTMEYKNKNKDELIQMVIDLQKTVNCVSIRVNDLEDYLDDILLKVMETVPKILEK